MFKNTSDNMNRRATSMVVNNSSNIMGMDDGAYKNGSEAYREKLHARKMNLQAECGKVKAELAVARRRFHAKEVGQIPREAYLALEAKKADLAAKLNDIDCQLTEIKLFKRGPAKLETESFAVIFKEMAKSLLAGPVYERIVIATIHRIGEGAQNENEERRA